MDNPNCFFSFYSIPEDRIPVPELLKNKDKRADSAARVAVQAAANALKGISAIDLTSLNVVVVNREGCKDHINKVTNGIKQNQPAQGFFVRGGPQTLATYTALALGSHGAAFTFVGDQKILKDAITTACYLACNTKKSATLLTVIVKKNDAGYQTSSALVRTTNHNYEIVSSSLEKKIHNHLSQAFNMEIVQ
jgi:hypothetical protein